MEAVSSESFFKKKNKHWICRIKFVFIHRSNNNNGNINNSNTNDKINNSNNNKIT